MAEYEYEPIEGTSSLAQQKALLIGLESDRVYEVVAYTKMPDSPPEKKLNRVTLSPLTPDSPHLSPLEVLEVTNQNSLNTIIAAQAKAGKRFLFCFPAFVAGNDSLLAFFR